MATIYSSSEPHAPLLAEVGATLLETMVVVAIASILLVLGVPGLIEMARDVRRDTRVSDIVVGLNLARSEAIKRNGRVTLCPSADGRNCNGDPLWETGWIIFTDANSNSIVDGDDAILRIGESSEEGGTLRGARNRLTYQGSGYSAGFTDTLRVCDTRGTDFARSVIISNTGRVRVKNKTSVCP